MVQQFTGRTLIEMTPDGDVETRVELLPEGPIPQLDIGLGVLTDAVRKGADFIHSLIVDNGITALPYNITLINVRAEADPPQP